MILSALFATTALAASAATTARIDFVKADMEDAGVPASYANALFTDRRLVPYKRLPPAPVEPNWQSMSANILAIDSVRRGTSFLDAYRDTLATAEATYGVPEEAIVAVLRVESNLGKYLGDSVVFNVFYTNLVNTKGTAWKWDAANLAALGSHCYHAQVDCFTIKGSAAGAFGLAQFLPHSLKTWGVDGNGDGIVDLFNPEDSILSAANFLKAHGWEDDEKAALGRYYGTTRGYAATVLTYAETIRKQADQIPDTNAAALVALPHSPTLSFFKALYCLFSRTPFCTS
jgi:membrane-bound lytic murein transglycosylase B